jgi:hypothetical protein
MALLRQAPPVETALATRAVTSSVPSRSAALALLALKRLALSAMHLGGRWFAYWIRQDDLQRGHLMLLVWILGAFFLFNGSWA